jgi:hypothetical protein
LESNIKLFCTIVAVFTMSCFTHLYAQIEITDWKVPEGGEIHALIDAGDTLFAYSHTGNVFFSDDEGTLSTLFQLQLSTQSNFTAWPRQPSGARCAAFLSNPNLGCKDIRPSSYISIV